LRLDSTIDPPRTLHLGCSIEERFNPLGEDESRANISRKSGNDPRWRLILLRWWQRKVLGRKLSRMKERGLRSVFALVDRDYSPSNSGGGWRESEQDITQVHSCTSHEVEKPARRGRTCEATGPQQGMADSGYRMDFFARGRVGPLVGGLSRRGLSEGADSRDGFYGPKAVGPSMRHVPAHCLAAPIGFQKN